MDSSKIIKQWLNDLAYSAATWNLEAHMSLVSKEVEVLGIPGVSKVDYSGWRKRRRNEFNKKLLHSLHHRDIRVLIEQPQRIIFTVQEVMKDHAKRSIAVSKEVTLQQENDTRWRVTREQIITINTAHH